MSKLVYCGLKEQKGFVWLGTSNGLQRFDGDRFRLFTKEKNHLSDNNAVRLAEDRDNRLWILYGLKGSDRKSAGMLDILNLKTLEVKSLKDQFGADLPFAESGIVTFCSNENHDLAIITKGTGNNSNVFLYQNGRKFRKIASDLPIDHEYPHHLIFRNKTILFYSKNQTGILTTDGKVVMTSLDLKKADNFFPLGVNREGEIFACTSSVGKPGKKFPNPLFMQVFSDGKTKEISGQIFARKDYEYYNQVYFRALYAPQTAEAIIYQQQKGIFLFSGENFVELADTLNLGNFQDLKLYDYFTVSDNQHWLCTSDGILIISRRPNHFAHLLSRDEIIFPSKLDHQVRSIYADTQGGVFINSWGGFYRASTNSAGKYDYQKLMVNERPLFDGFFYDGTDFWLASGDTGVIKYHYPEGEIEKFPADSLRLWSGVKTHEGQMLIGAVQGLGKFSGNRFARLDCNPKGKNPTGWVYQFFYGHDGKLWAVSNNGLYEINEKGCITSHYSDLSRLKERFIPYSDLHHVYEDKEGIFWMATNGAGLIKWNRRKGTFQQLTIADGLSSNVLYSILEDDFGCLWISSEFGLMRFNKENNAVKTYTVADGLTDNEFNRISYFKGPGGRLFFGGMNGVNAFYPGDFRSDSAVFDVPMQIISYNQFDGKLDELADKTVDLLESNTILVNPGDKFFILDFKLLDFSPGTHHYAYKIEGLDNDWNFIDADFIRISDLPYGKYSLRIKGQHVGGTWSAHELNITVIVVEPLLEKWWFRGLLLLFAGFMVYGFVRFRIREISRAKEELEKTVGERTRQLNISLEEKEVLMKEIHHRVNNNLQIVSGLLELEEKNSTDEKLTVRIAEGRNRLRSIALIHQNLYKNKNVAAIEVNSFLDGLIRQVKEVFRSEEKPVEILSSVPEMELDIETAVPLGLILNELLTNSFKYAFKAVAAGKIQIDLGMLEKGKYRVVYRDNGPGLPATTNLHTIQSMGMQLIFDLARQIGGHVHYELDNGSKFILTFTNNEYRKNSD